MIKECILVFLLFSSISWGCFSQERSDTVYVHNFPVKEGVIINHDYSLGKDRMGGVYVLANSDSVFHFSNGIVSSVFSIEDARVVLIKNSNGYFITYANLKESNLKKGDSVSKGTFIGTVLKDYDDEKFELVFVILKSEGRTYSFDKTVKYLKQYGLIN